MSPKAQARDAVAGQSLTEAEIAVATQGAISDEGHWKTR